MLRQKSLLTSLGQLTVSSLTIGELRQFDSLFTEPASAPGIALLLRYLPVLLTSIRKVHPTMQLEQLESALTLDDFQALFLAVLEVSGLAKAPDSGEAVPVAV
jgi:hypothetical protein